MQQNALFIQEAPLQKKKKNKTNKENTANANAVKMAAAAALDVAVRRPQKGGLREMQKCRARFISGFLPSVLPCVNQAARANFSLIKRVAFSQVHSLTGAGVVEICHRRNRSDSIFSPGIENDARVRFFFFFFFFLLKSMHI